jgi:hypothetical protein
MAAGEGGVLHLRHLRVSEQREQHLELRRATRRVHLAVVRLRCATRPSCLNDTAVHPVRAAASPRPPAPSPPAVVLVHRVYSESRTPKP